MEKVIEDIVKMIKKIGLGLKFEKIKLNLRKI